MTKSKKLVTRVDRIDPWSRGAARVGDWNLPGPDDRGGCSSLGIAPTMESLIRFLTKELSAMRTGCAGNLRAGFKELVPAAHVGDDPRDSIAPGCKAAGSGTLGSTTARAVKPPCL